MAWESQANGIWDSADIQNLYEGAGQNGIISGGVVTATGSDRVLSYTEIKGVYNGTPFTIAAGTVTAAVGDATKPRMSMVVTDGSTVSIEDGTATTESLSQTRPPLPELPSGSLMLSRFYTPAGAVVILDANVFDARVIIPATVVVTNYKSAAQVFTTDTAFADVTGADAAAFSFPIAASEVWRVEYWIPLAFGGTGGAKFQLTGPSAPTSVSITGTAGMIGIPDTGAAIFVADRVISPVTAFSSTIEGRNSAASFTDGAYASGFPALMQINAVIINGANAGTVTLQAAQSSSNSTTTLGLGSYMRAEKLN